MKYIIKILMLTVCIVALSGIAAACDVVECKSPGYWKNHPDDWPVQSITIGGVTYAKDKAIDMMQQPVKRDKSYTMFDALVAAKLNVANGCRPSSEITNTIRGADRWMKIHKLGDGVKANSDAWQEEFRFYGGAPYPPGEAMHQKLDAFNNGY